MMMIIIQTICWMVAMTVIHAVPVPPQPSKKLVFSPVVTENMEFYMAWTAEPSIEAIEESPAVTENMEFYVTWTPSSMFSVTAGDSSASVQLALGG